MAYPRYFVPADVEAVGRIFRFELDEAVPSSDLLAFSALWPAGQLVACDPAGRVVGAIFGTAEGGRARVTALAVAGGHRGKGVATLLMGRFMSESLMRGADRVVLEVRPGNAPALGFYRKMGFVETAYLENHYNDGGPCVVMAARASGLS